MELGSNFHWLAVIVNSLTACVVVVVVACVVVVAAFVVVVVAAAVVVGAVVVVVVVVSVDVHPLTITANANSAGSRKLVFITYSNNWFPGY